MPLTTACRAYPYPEQTDAIDVAADIQLLAEQVDLNVEATNNYRIAASSAVMSAEWCSGLPPDGAQCFAIAEQATYFFSTGVWYPVNGERIAIQMDPAGDVPIEPANRAVLVQVNLPVLPFDCVWTADAQYRANANTTVKVARFYCVVDIQRNSGGAIYHSTSGFQNAEGIPFDSSTNDAGVTSRAFGSAVIPANTASHVRVRAWASNVNVSSTANRPQFIDAGFCEISSQPLVPYQRLGDSGATPISPFVGSIPV